MPRDKYKVIVVDDSRPDVHLLQCALQEQHLPIDLEVFHDGEQMLRRVIEYEEAAGTPDFNPPDLILLDMHLPCYTGLEILAHIRQTGKLEDVPVAILSSSASPREEQQILSLGVAAYFRKPAGYDACLSLARDVRFLCDQLSTPLARPALS